jgi:dihydroorotate dehydrogenase
MSGDLPSMLELPSRWMNQTGTLGFSPALSQPVTNSVFVTNPVSYHSRKPSANREVIAYPGGFLMHTGLANPGWKSIRKKYSVHWTQYRLPVWIHIVSQDPADLEQLVRECEETEGITAIELGLPPGCPQDLMLLLIQQAYGEIPLILYLSTGEDLNLLRYLPSGISAVTLGSPRGRMRSEEGKVISGRLHGPGLFPLMLEALHSLDWMKIPIILAGICNAEDGKIALQNGAAAVQMDRLCWMRELSYSSTS